MQAIKAALLDYYHGAISRRDEQEQAMAKAAFEELGETPEEVFIELNWEEAND